MEGVGLAMLCFGVPAYCRPIVDILETHAYLVAEQMWIQGNIPSNVFISVKP